MSAAAATGIVLAWYLVAFHYLTSCAVNTDAADCRVKRGADVHARTMKGETPLHLAAARAGLEIIEPSWN